MGIDKGWAYAPGASVAEEVNNWLRDTVARLPPKLGSDLGARLPDPIRQGWERRYREVAAGVHHDPGFVGALAPMVLDVRLQHGIRPVSAEITVQANVVSGPKSGRHLALGDAFSADDWLALPVTIGAPVAVLRDLRSGKLLIVMAGGDRVPQLVVELDQLVSVDGRRDPKQIVNLVVSAYRPRRADLLGRLRGGLLVQLWGDLVAAG